MIKMKGPLLRFGVVDRLGYCFPKDCKISFPEKVPITVGFNVCDPEAVVGHGKIDKDEQGLNISAELIHQWDGISEHYVGGFYTGVKCHDEGDITIVDECKLINVALITDPVDEELKIRRVET